MKWPKWFIFWNIFLYCKIIISFLELFVARCFLCVLRTQLTRRNTSFPKKLKKRQHMTFKVTFANFFIKTYSILSIHYLSKVSCKMDKDFLRYIKLFHWGPTRTPLSLALRFSKKPS